MTQEKNEKVISWDEVKLGGSFIKFEIGVRTKIVLKSWKLVSREGKKYQSEETEMKAFLEAPVINQDGKPVDLILSTSSVPFLRAAEQVLRGTDQDKEITVSVKRLGEGSSTTYDVELVE